MSEFALHLSRPYKHPIKYFTRNTDGAKYSRTSLSGHSEKRTHSLEQTKLQSRIESPILVIHVHWQPPRSNHLQTPNSGHYPGPKALLQRIFTSKQWTLWRPHLDITAPPSLVSTCMQFSHSHTSHLHWTYHFFDTSSHLNCKANNYSIPLHARTSIWQKCPSHWHTFFSFLFMQ